MRTFIAAGVFAFSIGGFAQEIHFDYYDTMGPKYEDITIHHAKAMFYGNVKTSPLPGCNAGMYFPKDYFPGFKGRESVQEPVETTIAGRDFIKLGNLSRSLARLKDKMRKTYPFYCKKEIVLEAGFIHDMTSGETGVTERDVLSRIIFRLDVEADYFYLSNVNGEEEPETRIPMDSIEGVYSTGYYLPYPMKLAFIDYLKE